MRPLHATDPARTTPETLRTLLVRDGYLYLPGLLDPDDALSVERDLRAALHSVGWLAGPERLTVARPGLRFSADSFATVYPAVQRVESFHALAHHPRVRALAGSLLGEDVFCHPAKVVRLAAPTGDALTYATLAHQDFVVQHVAADVLTFWIPLTDCSPERQGLRILPGSHREGFLPIDPGQNGARPLYLDVPADDARWATADYRLGDVVVFHSLTVHSGGANTSSELRISADLRYQRTDEPMLAEFAHPHGWPSTPDWPALTSGWSSTRWCELPDGIDLVPSPGVPYDDLLTTLRAPYSRLLGPPRAGTPAHAVRKDKTP
ncbi:phytanoyl-CoA dioxygenase family protein [Streptomyces anulatus]|uniref:phytanoyl-CoA dioxygenase family protein n=1 Tax=Streptomyces anulatus TaxID=1892 RepID=UPI003701116E